MRLVAVLIMLVFLISPLAPAAASYIRIDTNLHTAVEGNSLRIICTSFNKGDEAAYNVQAEFLAAGRRVLTDKMTLLRVDGAYRAEVRLPLTISRVGKYPLIMILHYTDANQHPFSAVTVHTFLIGKDMPSPFFGSLQPVTIAAGGRLSATLKNLDDREIKTETVLVIPRELTVEEKRLPQTIAPRSVQKFAFTLQNFAAQSGSHYQVYMVSEGDTGDFHHTSIATGTVTIVEKWDFFGRNAYLLIIAVALLIIVFLAAQLSRQRS